MLEVVYALWRRDMIKFVRDRRQLITSLTRPFLWLLAFGFGLRASVRLPTGGTDYVSFLVPGLAAMTVLFASMFAAISIVWEREFGFLKELLVAPIPRGAIVARPGTRNDTKSPPATPGSRTDARRPKPNASSQRNGRTRLVTMLRRSRTNFTMSRRQSA